MDESPETRGRVLIYNHIGQWLFMAQFFGIEFVICSFRGVCKWKLFL